MVRWFCLHPWVVAVCQDSLSDWVCRLWGHRWAWPEIMVAMDFDRRTVEVSQDTYCVRCGYDEKEGYPETVLHLKNLSDSDVVGTLVKRAMGWDS
jgi:hypothetical protein